MKVGAPFNPYRVFQGVFAPYWILEHAQLGAGAKLCYVRLLGFAGKDARCYPALSTLGASLGVSDRQAREYVRELVQARLIAVEQRGLRKTNVYVFLWTQELEDMSSSVPERPDDPDDPQGGAAETSGSDRKGSSGPIGIISSGIISGESSSPLRGAKKSEDEDESLNRNAQAILDWASSRGLQRLRSDRRVGAPEKERLTQWAAICAIRDINEPEAIVAVMDAARKAADRSGDWRAWSYLTIQVQLACERIPAKDKSAEQAPQACPGISESEDGPEWAQTKVALRDRIAPIAFSNWFADTRQVERSGATLTVSVPNEPTRSFLEDEYRAEILDAVLQLGIDHLQFVVR
jgi:hypothetical protein